MFATGAASTLGVACFATGAASRLGVALASGPSFAGVALRGVIALAVCFSSGA